MSWLLSAFAAAAVLIHAGARVEAAPGVPLVSPTSVTLGSHLHVGEARMFAITVSDPSTFWTRFVDVRFAYASPLRDCAGGGSTCPLNMVTTAPGSCHAGDPVAPHEHCNVSVRFEPRVTGRLSATVCVNTSGPLGPARRAAWSCIQVTASVLAKKHVAPPTLFKPLRCPADYSTDVIRHPDPDSSARSGAGYLLSSGRADFGTVKTRTCWFLYLEEAAPVGVDVSPDPCQVCGRGAIGGLVEITRHIVVRGRRIAWFKLSYSPVSPGADTYRECFTFSRGGAFVKRLCVELSGKSG
jgi:hypothetical protein